MEHHAAQRASAPTVPAARWRLRPSHELRDEVARVLREQIAVASRWASVPPSQVDEAVHRIRRAIKRMRALGRLVRDAVGESVFREWNTRLRDQARRLATLRDATVLIAAVGRVEGAGRGDGQAFAAIRADLVHRSEAARRDLEASGTLAAVGASLADVGPLLADVLPASLSTRHLRRGLRREQRRARRQLERVLASASDGSLHELRKRVKIVRAHVECLRVRSDASASELEDRLERIGDLLGEDHDLALLAATVAERGAMLLVPKRAEADVASRIAKGRRALQKEALGLARLTLAARPKVQARRLLEAFVDA